MLAIDGTAPLAVLADLAADQGFRGVVLISFTPEWGEPAQHDAAMHHVQHYHRHHHVGGLIEAWLDSLAESWLVTLAPDTSPIRVAKALASRSGAVVPSYVVMNRQRERSADYLTQDPAWLTEHRDKRIARHLAGLETMAPLSPDAWLAAMEPVRQQVAAIESRGGRVVFFGAPMDDVLLQATQARYPRKHYWQALGRDLGLTTLDFADIPAMTGIPCPDGSHIDQTSKSLFTEALVGALQERGILAP
jgi:hypothetical protein